jgi:hypothetical protein
MPADFRARLRFEREAINHSQKGQDRNQNERNMEIRDTRSAARIAIQQSGKSQRDGARRDACSHAELGHHAGEARGRAQLRFWNVGKCNGAETGKLIRGLYYRDSLNLLILSAHERGTSKIDEGRRRAYTEPELAFAANFDFSCAAANPALAATVAHATKGFISKCGADLVSCDSSSAVAACTISVSRRITMMASQGGHAAPPTTFP